MSKTKLYETLREESSSMDEHLDCAVIAVSVACDCSYKEAHEALKNAGRKDNRPTRVSTTKKAIDTLGYKITIKPREWHEDMIDLYPAPHCNVLKNITPRHPSVFKEAWETIDETLILRSSGHIFTFKDGEIHDWSKDYALRIKEIWSIEKK